MARQKTPSPQEQFRARKVREEKERSALLPPGLLNHGNTCFMNSVLQGLIATQYLQRLVNYHPVPFLASSPIASRRSPVLTNIHGQHDQPPSDALPIGDQLVALLQTAWDIQNNRKRENITPKDLLSVVGKKYDQYLDFRQQDAHEFLYQLLDAIRMEENDIIKQRSPSSNKSRKRSQPSRSHCPTSQPVPHADELLPFVDMLFGGKLASILICQTCKHVSHTYEDFNDLSLSIKPEDYTRERKRDRLREFAKKIGTAFYPGVPQQRSSSVPATPIRDSHLDSPPVNDSQRRRSIDLADVDIVAEPVHVNRDTGDTTRDETTSQVPPSPALDSASIPGTPADTAQPVHTQDLPTAVEPSGDNITIVAPEKVNGKDRKDKDESWARLSKRISVSVGLTRRSKSERKDKKGTPSMTPLKPVEEGNLLHQAGSAAITTDTVSEATSPYPHPERESTSLGLVNERLQVQPTNVKRSVMPTQRSGNSPSGSSTPRFPLASRPSSPRTRSKTSKPPRPPKLSAEEEAYLRDILADINPPNFQKSFSIFKQSKDLSLTSTFQSQNIFLKVNQINKIEECLRLFTSVEVLNGDNTVRCHRCWKIANGFYKPRAMKSAQESDSCTDSEGDEAAGTKSNGNHFSPDSIPTNLVIPVASLSHPVSPSHSTSSLQDTQISRDTPSTLTQRSTHRSSTYKPIPPALQLNDEYPIELVSPIRSETPTQKVLATPSTSTTPPQSPMSVQTAKPAPIRGNTISSTLTQMSVATEYTSSRVSLNAPSNRHRHHGLRGGDSNTESEISEGESETLLSVYSDVSSPESSNPSRNASQDHLEQPSSTPGTHSKDERHPSGVPRSRQYLLRPAYKRYLIAMPPPILVVHLKRFQQLSKTPVVSFSTGFKKLDDYISFPEHLDLAPYLAPKREDYFDSKVAVTRGRSRRPAPCMYRLYAVVVHIGNMLGGHYVAYTALPPSPSETEAARPGDGEKQQSRDGTAPRDWAFISDTVVRLSSLEEVLKSKAYICMYERI